MGLAQTEHGAVTHAELSADAVIAPPVFGEAPDCRDTFDLSKSGWLTAGHEGLDRDLVEVFGVLTGRGGFGVRVVDVIFVPGQWRRVADCFGDRADASAILAAWKAPGSEFGNQTRIKAVPSASTITVWVTAVDANGTLDLAAAQAKSVPAMINSMSDRDGKGEMGTCALSPDAPLPPISVASPDDTAQ